MAGHKTHPAVPRRTALKAAVGVGGLLSVASFAKVLGVHAADTGDDPQTILNLAATAETLAVTHYYSILTARTFALEDDEVVYLKYAMDEEQQHLDFLIANGGKSLTQQFYVPATVLTDVSVFVDVTSIAETAFVGAYLAATRRFAELGVPALAATTAQVACIEAQHLALVRDIGDLVPNNIVLAQPVYYNVSDAVPTLAPFLQGATGFIGPVNYPTSDQIAAALDGAKAEAVLPFTMAY